MSGCTLWLRGPAGTTGRCGRPGPVGTTKAEDRRDAEAIRVEGRVEVVIEGSDQALIARGRIHLK
jgi:hypothetical protein